MYRLTGTRSQLILKKVLPTKIRSRSIYNLYNIDNRNTVICILEIDWITVDLIPVDCIPVIDWITDDWIPVNRIW